MNQRFIDLGWWLIEAKLMYYRPDLVPKKTAPTDAEYDAKETEYRELAQQLGVPPTAVDMVGVDLERPAVQLAIAKLAGR